MFISEKILRKGFKGICAENDDNYVEYSFS
jgi:hypothetical protein